VDDFDHDVQNRLGGFRNTYERPPSGAAALRVADVRRGNSGRAVRIQADRRPQGFCGFWVHFFNMRADESVYFDSRRFSHLSFWIKGRDGGELFAIRLADEKRIAKEDSVPIGKITDFLPGGVTTQWQEVLVPLPSSAVVDRQRLGGLTLDFNRPGRFVIYVDDIRFKATSERPVPIEACITNERRATNGSTGPRGFTSELPSISCAGINRALWIWSTEPLLVDPIKTKALLELCKRHHIDRLWMQLPYSAQRNEAGAARCTIRHTDRLRRFLRHAHDAQIDVHALDGDPEFCVEERHDIPLAVVDAVTTFNRQSKREERFDGVHFDNEPYLLLGWHDPVYRQQILRDYLDLNQECQARIRKQPGLVFGVDIPFWWQEKDQRTGEPIGVVTFNGKRQAASFHCIDMLDHVGIMNYRDQADGADGMIVHGRDLLRYGDDAGQARVIIGVETYIEPPQEVCFSLGLPEARFLAALRGEGREMANRSRVEGHRLRAYHDGRNVHVGIAVPPGESLEGNGPAMGAWLKIARFFGADAGGITADRRSEILAHVRETMGRDVEWDGFREKTLTDTETKRNHTAFSARSHMLSKITFADDSYEDMRVQMQAAEDYFRQYSCYDGMAIHYLGSFQKLLATEASAP
jgi:hypothetical protein